VNVDSYFISNHLYHGLCTKYEVFQAGIEFLNGLEWKLNGPTAIVIDFVHAFMELIDHEMDAEDLYLLMDTVSKLQ
jgi:hypothetical protein